MEDQSEYIRKLRWQRRLVLSWPSLVAAICTYGCYRGELASAVSWLIDHGVPVTRWLDHIEVDNQLFPFAFMGTVTLLTLFQKPFGYALFFLVTILVTGCSAFWLLDYYISGNALHRHMFSISWIAFVLGMLALLLLAATLYQIVRIDEKIARLTLSSQEPVQSPEQTDEQ